MQYLWLARTRNWNVKPKSRLSMGALNYNASKLFGITFLKDGYGWTSL
jgi:hypothetical protein